MHYTSFHKGLFAFTLLYIGGATLHYLKDLNYEFLAYVVLLIGILIFIVKTLPSTQFSPFILTGLSLWGFLHMLGGSLMVGDGVLYAYRIYPFFDGGAEFYILKFDQVVHAMLYAIVGLMFYQVLRGILALEGRTCLIAFIAVMASLGVSAINEIIEFGAVLLVPDNGVGGYYNTALDIVFNFLGAFFAVGLKVLFERR